MKKLLSFLLAVTMMVSMLSVNAFAAEAECDVAEAPAEATMYDVELNSSGIVSITDENGAAAPRSVTSSISGYGNANLTSSSNVMVVWVDASGFGGVGITVTTSCSNWNGTITFNVTPNNGSAILGNKYISSNGTSEFHNLWHNSPAYYTIAFGGIPAGYTVHAQVWIYG